MEPSTVSCVFLLCDRKPKRWLDNINVFTCLEETNPVCVFALHLSPNVTTLPVFGGETTGVLRHNTQSLYPDVSELERVNVAEPVLSNKYHIQANASNLDGHYLHNYNIL